MLTVTWTSIEWSDLGSYFGIPCTVLYKHHTVTGWLRANAGYHGCLDRHPVVFGPRGKSRFCSARCVITKLVSKIHARDSDTAEPPWPCTHSCMCGS